MFKTLLSSKKFIASFAGMLFVILNQVSGVPVPEDTVLQVVGLLAAYILGQGIADKGKEEARIYVEDSKE
jgi:hypothetical protein